MGMNFDDEQLMISLLKFVSGSSVQFQLVDLYGNNKPSQLFDTTTTTATKYHVFTQLKKKKGNGKNFNRGIVGGGGSWKGVDNSRPVYDKKKSVIGFKKTFRFEEKNHVWIMKEYRLCDKILKALRLRGHTRHEEEFVVCRITRSVNSSQVIIPSDHNVENFLDSLLISSLQCQESFAQNQFQDLGQSFAQYQFQENQDLEQLSTPNVIPSDESNSILNGNQIGPVSLVLKESKLCAAIEEECSVPVVNQQTPSVSLLPIEEECSVPVVNQQTPSVKEVECSVYDIATYHKQLDAYAASVLETMVPYIPQQQEDEADSIPPFYEDFYMGYTDLWS
ncbi:hypothetical protein KY284_013162 [Solanum tuberosum]|nr:hypothetical protein KY284_013162 [Solanum tuberosum]